MFTAACPSQAVESIQQDVAVEAEPLASSGLCGAQISVLHLLTKHTHNCQAINYMVELQAAVYVGGQELGSTGKYVAGLMIVDMPRVEVSNNHDSGILQPMAASRSGSLRTNMCLINVSPIGAVCLH